MAEGLTDTTDRDAEGPNRTGLLISVVILLAYAAVWMVQFGSSNTGGELLLLSLQLGVVSVVIWQACDPFADAAQWIGQRLRLPGSVRGATLDAVASSMPELFSGIFFVLAALTAVSGGSDADRVAAGAEGFGSTIATCAGSAVYNMILIPAFCTLVISFTRRSRPTIDVEPEVITRDGLWFVGCSAVLIAMLFGETMSWWMAVILWAMYGLYITHLYVHAVRHRAGVRHIHAYLQEHGTEVETAVLVESMSENGVRLTATSASRVRDEFRHRTISADSDDEHAVERANVFFGYASVPLNLATCAAVILVSTAIVAVACYFLVQATRDIAEVLHVPAFFVAVILAAAASSVPDTLLAIGAARRGDDSGAVSNAFGSSIFDICVSLSIPLIVNSYLTDWQPVSLLQDGKPIAGLVGLRFLLMLLTLVTLAVMWHRRQLTRSKALFFCGLYLVFIGYAVMGSLGWLD